MASNDIEIRLSVSGGQQAQKSIEKVEKASVDLKEGAKGIGETFSSVGEAVEKSGGLMGAGFAAVGESVLGVSEAVGGMKDALATAGEVGGKAWLNMLGPAALLISAVGAAIEAFREFSGAAREAEMWEEAMSATASDLTSRMEALAEEGIKPSTAELKGFIEANQQARLTLELLGLKNETLVKKYQERKKWSDLVSKAEKQQAEEAKKANVQTGLLSKAGGVVADVFTDVASVFVSVEKSTVDLKIAKESLAKANEAVAKGERELALVYEKEVIPQLQAALKAQTVASNTQEKLDDQLYERLKELEDLNIQKLELQKKDKDAIDLIGSSTQALTDIQNKRKEKEAELNEQLRKGIITQDLFQEKVFALKGETYDLIKAEEARIEIEKRSLRGIQDRADKEEKIQKRTGEARQRAEEFFNLNEERLNKEAELYKKRVELLDKVLKREGSLLSLRAANLKEQAAFTTKNVEDVIVQAEMLLGRRPFGEVAAYKEIYNWASKTGDRVYEAAKVMSDFKFSVGTNKIMMDSLSKSIRALVKDSKYSMEEISGVPTNIRDFSEVVLSQIDAAAEKYSKKVRGRAKQNMLEDFKNLRENASLDIRKMQEDFAQQAKAEIRAREEELNAEKELLDRVQALREDMIDKFGATRAAFASLDREFLQQSNAFLGASNDVRRKILLEGLTFEEGVLQRRSFLEEKARVKALDNAKQEELRRQSEQKEVQARTIELQGELGTRQAKIRETTQQIQTLTAKLAEMKKLQQEGQQLRGTGSAIVSTPGFLAEEKALKKTVSQLEENIRLLYKINRDNTMASDLTKKELSRLSKVILNTGEEAAGKRLQIDSEYLIKQKEGFLALQQIIKKKDELQLQGLVENLKYSEEYLSVSRMLFSTEEDILKEAAAITALQDKALGRGVEDISKQLSVLDDVVSMRQRAQEDIKLQISTLSPEDPQLQAKLEGLQKELELENATYKAALEAKEELLRNSNTAIAEINAQFRQKEKEDAAAGWKAIGDMLKEMYITQVQAISSGLGQIFYDESTDQKLKELESNRQAAMDQYKGDMKARADIEKQYLQQKRQIQAEDANMVSNLLKQTLRAAAQEALVKSIYHTGLGFGALAMGPLGGMSAAGHFKAAAIFAGLATLSGIASKAAGSGAAGAGASTSLSPTGASQTTSAPVREEAKNTEPIVFNINLAGATVYDTRQAAEQAMANRIMSLANRSVRGASNPFTR